jgi:hypothetical protein
MMQTRLVSILGSKGGRGQQVSHILQSLLQPLLALFSSFRKIIGSCDYYVVCLCVFEVLNQPDEFQKARHEQYVIGKQINPFF